MRDKGFRFDTPETFKEYLGCVQRSMTITLKEVQRRLEHIYHVQIDPNRPEAALDIAKRFAGKPICAIAYDMRDCFQQVVDKYL